MWFICIMGSDNCNHENTGVLNKQRSLDYIISATKWEAVQKMYYSPFFRFIVPGFQLKK